MTQAVFLDRDGVLNEVVFRNGKPASPRTFEEFRLLPGARDAATTLREAGFLVFVVTNQPDVARGKMDARELDAMHRHLSAHVPGIREIAACTHDDDHRCRCRKPLPGMLEDLAAKWDVDLARSWIVGDSVKDMEAGRAAGVRTVLLPRDYNAGTSAEFEAKDVLDAARLIAAMTSENTGR